MDADAATAVDAFLAQPMPPVGTVMFLAWQHAARGLPAGSDEVLHQALGTADPDRQLVCLVALRTRGVQAWVEEANGEVHFHVRPPGSGWTRTVTRRA